MNIKNKKTLIIIISILLSALILVGSGLGIYIHFIRKDKKPTGNKITISRDDVNIGDDLDDNSDDDSDEEFEDDFDDDFEDFDDDFADLDDEFEDDFEKIYSTVSLNLSKPITKEYINSGLYLGWGYFPDAAGRTYTKKEITAELDRLKKMGYTHVRTSLTTSWVGSGYDNAAKDWKWDGEEFTRFVWICKELDKRGITLTMTINWDMTTDLTSNGIYDKNSYENTCKNFAEYGYKLLSTLKAKGVNNIVNILPYCEPYPSKKIDNIFGKYTNEIWRDTVKELDAELQEKNIRKDYKILCNATTILHLDAPQLNELGFTKETWANWIIDNCDNFIDIYAYHLYSNYSNNIYDDTYQYFYDDIIDVANIFKKTGKPLYFDEFGYQYNESLTNVESTYTRYLHRNVPFYATQRAAGQIAIMNSGANCSMNWSIFDTQFPDSTITNTAFDKGVQVTGCAPIMSESSVPYAEYYSQSLISRYMAGREGTVVYEGTDDMSGVYTVATKQKDGTFSILAVNLNVHEAEVTFELSESLKKAKLYRHLFNPNNFKATTAANIIGVDKAYKNVNKTFKDILPAGAVVVYTTNPN